MPKYGVIDLGTNTFHLLIVQTENGQFHPLFRERVFVRLAEDGINTIGPGPYQRGLDCMRRYRTILDQNEVSQVTALGTAALRMASNGPKFVDDLYQQTGIEVQVISGDREAQLIHRGVSHAIPLERHTSLIMDIGGGSVEFIVADHQRVHWAQSFPIGVAILFQKFHHDDPISETSIQQLYTYLSDILQPLLPILEQHQIQNLIGASGTFDVLETYLGSRSPHDLYSTVFVPDFYPIKDQLLKTTLEERLQMPQLPSSRAEMIIVALLLIDYILERARPQNILVSSYAMKEGMLQEMIDQALQK
ncbi:MAG: phosphatase [Bacteroidota bacterium]